MRASWVVAGILGFLAVSSVGAEVVREGAVTVIPRAGEVAGVADAVGASSARVRRAPGAAVPDVPALQAPWFRVQDRPGYPADEPPAPGSE